MTTQTVSKTFQLEVDVDMITYTVSVEAHAKCYYHPGRLSGPPEDCYPPESDQDTTVEVLDAFDSEGKEVPLTPEFLWNLEVALPFDWIETQLWKQFMEGPEY